MTHTLRRHLCAALALLLLLYMVPVDSDAAEEVYYGEAYLDLQTEEQRIAYRVLEEGIASLSPSISFRGIVEIEYAPLLEVVQAVTVDHPQYSWFLEDGTAFVCEVRFISGGFWDWLDRSYPELFTLLGLPVETEIYYFNASDVYYLILIADSVEEQPPVSAIALEQSGVTLSGPGSRYLLQPKTHADSIYVPDLVYESSDPQVAVVDAQGMVTAVSQGTAVITASDETGEVSAACTVTVVPADVHVHTMRPFGAADPTCTQEGHTAYYLCTDCGRRYADEAGTLHHDEASDYTVPAEHRRLIYISQSGYHIQRCKCGVDLTDSKQAHVDDNNDGICEICNLSVRLSGLDVPTEPQQEDGPKA